MMNWKPEFSPQALYFITTSSHLHSTIFKDNVNKQIILDLFDGCRRQKLLKIYSFSFLEQKIDYIHQNPCRFPWKISNYPEEYPWSSARFYLSDFPCIIPIDDIREILV